MASDNLIIFDTTLRDGEQSPGFSMNTDEKLRLGRQLEALGVDIIEAGYPIASDAHAVELLAREIRRPIVAALARCNPADIERAGETIKPAARSRIHTFIATADLHLERKLRITRDQCLAAVIDGVTQARRYTDDVEFSAEDATRTDMDFLCRVVETAIGVGATTINLPDTVGYCTPEEIEEFFTEVLTKVSSADQAIFSTHCHDDLGLAVANSLAALQAGARQVECTINGLGERAGNAAMEEIVMAMRTRHDLLNFDCGIVTEKIMRASRLVSQITGFVVQPNKAIVGANAFAHEAGIHQDGVLKDAQTYEIMTPESVGLKKSILVMGKHSGRHAFREKLRELGYDEFGDNALHEAFTRFKDLADQKKEIFDEDIVALVDDEMGRASERIGFMSLAINCGSHGPQQAPLKLSVDGDEKSSTATGTGPVDATFNAIKDIFPHDAELQLYQVHAVTEGTDAQAEVTVRLREDGRMVNGQGAHIDTLVASARAYVHALNKLLVKRQKTAPTALTA